MNKKDYIEAKKQQEIWREKIQLSLREPEGHK